MKYKEIYTMFLERTKKVKLIQSYILISILSFSLFFIGGSASAQISFTNPNITPAYAVTDVLLGAGVTSSNITFNGSSALANNPHPSVREFSNTSAVFPLGDGVFMQTDGGSVISDPDLAAITTSNVTNGAIIEFDFIPEGDTLSFSYIFTSAEYSSYTCSNYNDVFGFFISGPGFNGPFTNNAENIATVPGKPTIPVGINSVNSGYPTGSGSVSNCDSVDMTWQANSVYFTTSYNAVYNSSSALNPIPMFNGSTVELTANASVECGETYHIKLAISNVSDQSYDSGVFLKAGSFASQPAIEITSSNNTSNFLDTVVVEGCDDGEFCFSRDAAVSGDTAVVYYDMSGAAIYGTDYNFTNLPNTGDSIVLLPGDTTFCLDFIPVDDGIPEGPEDIVLTAYTINACGDTLYSSSDIWLVDKPEDLVTDAGQDTVICNGGDGTLNGTYTVGTNDVIWTYTGSGTITFTPNDQTVDAQVHFDTPGDYILYLTESNDTCSLQKTDSILVTYEELTFSASNDTTICENGEATLLAEATGGNNFDYHWGHTSSLDSNQLVSPGSQTDFTVYAESDNGCETPIANINVNVHPPLEITSVGTQTICLGDTIEVSASASGGNGGPYNYEWTNPAGTVVGNNSSINVSPSTTTTYTITVSDDCESTPVTTTSKVIVGELPDVQFSVANGEMCTPAVFKLYNDTEAELVNETYWNISNGDAYMGNDSVEVEIKAPGSYHVQMIVVTPEGCVDSATVNGMLTVYPSPEAAFSYYPKPATILNMEVNFQNYSQGADSYEWSFESGDPEFSFLTDPITVYPEGETGTYEVELVAESMFGCTDTVRHLVSVVPEVLIFAPNSFTPDGDEHNPTWKPIIEGIDKMNVTVEIFNRWGEKVWESHDLDVGWDGTYGEGGALVKTGAYVWKVKAKNLVNDEKYEWTGTVTVLY